MFIGRENELAILKESYRFNGFKMVVVYGQRRVGKSYLLQHFFRNLDAKVVAFQAIANDVSLSIETFRDALFEVYPPEYDINLDTWKKCFQYFVGQLGDDKAVICIDEINYIFKEDPTFASLLQSVIENQLKEKNVLLIVCGSNVTTIEEEILADNSPLYGRRNLSIKLQEFDYRKAAEFYPNYSHEDKVIAYSVFGGKGKNLSCIDPSKSIEENIIDQILTPGGPLADEIDLLLKDDFRETGFYKELLYIMSMGNTSFGDIVNKSGQSSAKVSIYLEKLIDLRMVEKVRIGSKKNDVRYFIQDNFFSFYFRFVYKKRGILNILVAPKAFYDRFIKSDLYSFVGLKFESICEQYIIRKSYLGELDFIPTEYGKYYGKHRDGSTFDIDVFFRDETTAMCGECKFTNKEFSIADADELVENAKEISAKEIRYYVFSKSAVKDSVLQKYPFLTLVSLEDLFRE